MSSLVDIAVKRIAALKGELVGLEVELVELESFVATAGRLATGSVSAVPDVAAKLSDTSKSTSSNGATKGTVVKAPDKVVAPPPATKAPVAAARRQSAIGDTTESAVIEIIKQAKAPVPLSELVKKLADKGVNVGGKAPTKTLYARLLRAPAVRYVRPDGWTLSEAPANAASNNLL